MKKILMIGAVFALVGCADNRNTFDRYSELGALSVEEKEFSFLEEPEDIQGLVNFIKEITSENKRKKYILFDVESRTLSSAKSTVEKLEEQLSGVPHVHFDVRYRLVPVDKVSAQNVIKIKSLFIKPRDCAPPSKSLLGRNGGYNSVVFGCAYANNIGAMIDNPRDVIAPRGNETINPQRTMRMLRAYIDGEATGSALPENEAGEASEVTSSD